MMPFATPLVKIHNETGKSGKSPINVYECVCVWIDDVDSCVDKPPN